MCRYPMLVASELAWGLLALHGNMLNIPQSTCLVNGSAPSWWVVAFLLLACSQWACWATHATPHSLGSRLNGYQEKAANSAVFG